MFSVDNLRKESSIKIYVGVFRLVSRIPRRFGTFRNQKQKTGNNTIQNGNQQLISLEIIVKKSGEYVSNNFDLNTHFNIYAYKEIPQPAGRGGSIFRAQQSIPKVLAESMTRRLRTLLVRDAGDQTETKATQTLFHSSART